MRRFGLSLALIAAAASLSGASFAAEATGVGRARIVMPLATQSQAVQFGRLQPSPAGTATVASTLPPSRSGDRVQLLPGSSFSPGLVVLTGEPGLSYRITLPAQAASSPGGYLVNGFTVSTANDSQVTSGLVRQGQLDAQGKDTVRIGATINLPRGTGGNQTYSAAVSVSVSYD